MSQRRAGVWTQLAVAFVAAALAYLGFVAFLGLTLGYPPDDPGLRQRNAVLAWIGLGAWLGFGAASLWALVTSAVLVVRRLFAPRP